MYPFPLSVLFGMGALTHFVGIMEFRGDKVVRETIYFGEPWTPPAWRAQWVEQIQSECR